MESNSLKFIELFAGCGGMSLGLKSAGFQFFMGNELSPMAAETYAYNLLGENLKGEKPQKTLWLQSNYEKENKQRLTENPNDFHKGNIRDVNNNTSLEGKFLVGDIYTLLEFIRKNPKIKNQLKKAKIDLVSGGPPCQSFSLAGRREKDNKRNNLPWAFAEFIELVQPKLVLLENVSGILRAFNTPDGKYYAWFEVAKAFALKGYVPISMHINAKYFNLPQNRPRFILLAIRFDLIKRLKGQEIDEVLISSLQFFNDVKKSDGKISILEADYYKHWDLMSAKDVQFFKKSPWLPTPLSTNSEDYKSVDFAIGSLIKLGNKFCIKEVSKDPYYQVLETIFPFPIKNGDPKEKKSCSYFVENHNQRKHSIKTKERFKFYKIILGIPNGEKNKLFQAFRTGKIQEIENETMKYISSKCPRINNKYDLEVFIKSHTTKKYSQRPLQKENPAPAALSIPDDICHYDLDEDRTLTVREMARIQSFPDWFVFRTKDTTGGKNRRFEVPNYTQIGNAVPPLLANELGKTIIKILKNF